MNDLEFRYIKLIGVLYDKYKKKNFIKIRNNNIFFFRKKYKIILIDFKRIHLVPQIRQKYFLFIKKTKKKI